MVTRNLAKQTGQHFRLEASILLGGVSMKTPVIKKRLFNFRPFTPPSPRRLHITACHRTS